MSDSQRSVLVVVGTRPELIKLAPVLRALEDSETLSGELLHTGQHYDEELSDAFFETLDLPSPTVTLGIGSGSHAEQTAEALVGIEGRLRKTTPDALLAQGDTNAVLSAALAASKLPARFGHVEAGLRSFDRTMPEEINRIVADDVADHLFAPTAVAAGNLADENVAGTVHVTGNTVVDACLEHREIAERESAILDSLGVEADEYAVATIHRPRNTDDPDRLRAIVDALDGTPFPVVCPTHPRTRAALNEHGIEPVTSLRLVDPLDYLDFLKLLSNARVAVTDSGGVQEEAAVLETPCLTVRPNTERPETVDAGVNELVEPDALADRLRAVFASAADAMTGAADLYGDGRAGERIVGILARELG
jgi:UDP-N-acetylglucosamine 2-epimerase (non-hydrolysing)